MVLMPTPLPLLWDRLQAHPAVAQDPELRALVRTVRQRTEARVAELRQEIVAATCVYGTPVIEEDPLGIIPAEACPSIGYGHGRGGNGDAFLR